jgi:large subunit ribosomal protein L32
MAIPFRRTSKTKKRLRRTHFKLTAPGLIKCSNCGAMIPSHRVCPKCGFYDKQAKIDVGAPVKEKAVKANPKAKKETKK